jgi:hypothetical protein
LFLVLSCEILVILSLNSKSYLLHLRHLEKHRKLRDPEISTTCTHSVYHFLY